MDATETTVRDLLKRHGRLGVDIAGMLPLSVLRGPVVGGRGVDDAGSKFDPVVDAPRDGDAPDFFGEAYSNWPDRERERELHDYYSVRHYWGV